jgi:hypothetical protein
MLCLSVFSNSSSMPNVSPKHSVLLNSTEFFLFGLIPNKKRNGGGEME